MRFLYVAFCLTLIKCYFGQLSIDENGKIRAENVTEEDLWKCFYFVKRIYHIENRVEVCLVKSKEHSTKYVLKRLAPRYYWGFHCEVEINSSLPSSPYFIKYFGSFEIEGNGNGKSGFIVMEYIDNLNLHLTMKEITKRMEYDCSQLKYFEWIKFIAAELATAIQLLHDNNIVHCDIKPTNIIIDGDGHLKLIDFGTAIAMKSLNKPRSKRIGTKGFMAPEISEGNYNNQIDWYSYGKTLMNLLEIFEGEEENWGFSKWCGLFFNGTLQLTNSCLRTSPLRRIKSRDELKRFRFFRNVNWEEMDKRNARPSGIFLFYLLLVDFVLCLTSSRLQRKFVELKNTRNNIPLVH